MTGEPGGGGSITLKELVLEMRNDIHTDLKDLRDDVKSLNEKIDRIDRQGSIGTREELRDHEDRIRSLEQWRYALPIGIIIAVAAMGTEFFRVLNP